MLDYATIILILIRLVNINSLVLRHALHNLLLAHLAHHFIMAGTISLITTYTVPTIMS